MDELDKEDRDIELELSLSNSLTDGSNKVASEDGGVVKTKEMVCEVVAFRIYSKVPLPTMGMMFPPKNTVRVGYPVVCAKTK